MFRIDTPRFNRWKDIRIDPTVYCYRGNISNSKHSAVSEPWRFLRYSVQGKAKASLQAVSSPSQRRAKNGGLLRKSHRATADGKS